jgi:hypothetical protein
MRSTLFEHDRVRRHNIRMEETAVAHASRAAASTVT